MADSLTPNYEFILPEIDGSDDTWGDKGNDNWDRLDTILANMSGGVPTAVLSKSWPIAPVSDVPTYSAWATYPVDTKEKDDGGLLSLVSNEFTPDFDGWVEWQATFGGVAVSTIAAASRLYNVTDSVVVSEGITGIAFSNTSIGGLRAEMVTYGGGPLIKTKKFRFEYYAFRVSASNNVSFMPQQLSASGFPQANVKRFRAALYK